MKAVLNRADPLGDDVKLEVARAINRDQLEVKIVFDDGSGQGIVIFKQDLIDALKAM